MNQDQERLLKVSRDLEYLNLLKANKISIPNEFTIGFGKLLKAAREEKGYSQTILAKKLSRRQAMISEIESGKIETDIQTLVLFSLELEKPISYFIPEMTFLTSVNDIHEKWEEEGLLLLRELRNKGDASLAIKFLKMLNDYYDESN
jgi:transcriptional regulator with XRE-family HTH domain